MQNERKVLVSALLKAEKSGYSNIVLDNILKETDLDFLGKSFVTTAFYGVLERKLTIDFILNKENSEITMDMPKANLPVVSVLVDNSTLRFANPCLNFSVL